VVGVTTWLRTRRLQHAVRWCGDGGMRTPRSRTGQRVALVVLADHVVRGIITTDTARNQVAGSRLETRIHRDLRRRRPPVRYRDRQKEAACDFARVLNIRTVTDDIAAVAQNARSEPARTAARRALTHWNNNPETAS
jgi:hypothetical protein